LNIIAQLPAIVKRLFLPNPGKGKKLPASVWEAGRMLFLPVPGIRPISPPRAPDRP